MTDKVKHISMDEYFKEVADSFSFEEIKNAGYSKPCTYLQQHYIAVKEQHHTQAEASGFIP